MNRRGGFLTRPYQKQGGLGMIKNRVDLLKWLKILLYCEIAALAFALLEYIPGDNTPFTWLQRICQGGSLVCLFAVAFAGKRYLTAAVLGSVQLVLTVAQSVIIFFFQLLMMQGILHTDDFKAWSNFCAVLNLIAMVAGWIYTYQLYHAHGNLIKDQKNKWCHLRHSVASCSLMRFPWA